MLENMMYSNLRTVPVPRSSYSVKKTLNVLKHHSNYHVYYVEHLPAWP